eukprot:m.186713 g.186713  ORF g.186713 m.186713 type:complete len:362 (+) comp16862_c0_seq1:621-1706(+)
MMWQSMVACLAVVASPLVAGTTAPTTAPVTAAPTSTPSSSGAPTTAAPVTSTAVDRVLLTLSVRPSALAPSYWRDQRPPVPPFETAVAAAVCSARAGIYTTVSVRTRCLQELRVHVAGVTSRLAATASTSLNFYATFSGAIVPGQDVVRAVHAHTVAELSDMFNYPVLSVASEALATTAATTTSGAPQTSSSDNDGRISFMTSTMVIIAIIVILIVLFLVTIFAIIRLRRVSALINVLQSGPQYTKLDPHGTREGHSSKKEASTVDRPPQGMHTSGPGMYPPATHTNANNGLVINRAFKPSASTMEHLKSQAHNDEATTTKPLPPSKTPIRLNFDQRFTHGGAESDHVDLSLPHGTESSRW